MNGVRFYKEFKARRRSPGTVVAAFVGNGAFISDGPPCQECVVGLFEGPRRPWPTCASANVSARRTPGRFTPGFREARHGMKTIPETSIASLWLALLSVTFL